MAERGWGTKLAGVGTCVDAYAHGQVLAGLRARGNFTLDLEWKDSALARATLTSHSGGVCKLRYRDKTVELPTDAGRTYALSADLKTL